MLGVFRRSRSSVSWLYRVAAFVCYWFVGYWIGRFIIAWVEGGSSGWLWACVGSCVFFVPWALRFDLTRLPADQTLDEALHERERERRSLRQRDFALTPRHQRPALRIVAMVLWIVSGVSLTLSDLWIDSGNPDAVVVGGTLAACAVLGVAALVSDAAGRDDLPWRQGRPPRSDR